MKIDVHSETWQSVKATAEHVIAGALRRLEAPGTEPVATEFARGQIAAMRALLKQGEPRQEIRMEPFSGY
jgi:hypothetical protein